VCVCVCVCVHMCMSVHLPMLPACCIPLVASQTKGYHFVESSLSFSSQILHWDLLKFLLKTYSMTELPDIACVCVCIYVRIQVYTCACVCVCVCMDVCVDSCFPWYSIDQLYCAPLCFVGCKWVFRILVEWYGATLQQVNMHVLTNNGGLNFDAGWNSKPA